MKESKNLIIETIDSNDGGMVNGKSIDNLPRSEILRRGFIFWCKHNFKGWVKHIKWEVNYYIKGINSIDNVRLRYLINGSILMISFFYMICGGILTILSLLNVFLPQFKLYLIISWLLNIIILLYTWYKDERYLTIDGVESV